ncbi:MAG: hypothetical protein VB089_17385, partial [Anaerolineaceae bacterium]|nr:hypothetical protein [Anaerolineaceae bacterium]
LQAGWQPAGESDRRLFQELSACGVTPADPQTFFTGLDLPPACLGATLHLSGRFNEIAFAPHQPWLAIATGSRKVILWDYQQGILHTTLRGFQHSVANLAFLEDGRLVCAERSRKDERCELYLWDNGELRAFGAHTGAVTELAIPGPGRCLSAGRDGQVILWDVDICRPISSCTLSAWPRSLCIREDGAQLLAVHSQAELYNLPGLEHVTTFPLLRDAQKRDSIGRRSVFLPGGSRAVVAQNNGQIAAYSLPDGPAKWVGRLPTPAAGLHVVPSRNMLLAAGMGGNVFFYATEGLEGEGSLVSPIPQLTSLHVSPDDRLMAVSSSLAHIGLWDLRLGDLPTLFAMPLALSGTGAVATYRSLLACSSLPGALRPILAFGAALLQHRFRFEIQLGDLPLVSPGEFDILID